MSIMCPICGYPDIREPSLKWSICPSCGTKFGLTNIGRTDDEIRAMWIAGGACWHSSVVTQPRYWSPIRQLQNIGYVPTIEEIRAIASHREDTSMAIGPSSNVRVRNIAVQINQSRVPNPLKWVAGLRLLPESHFIEVVSGSFTPQTA
jgi:hypothetical protein